MRLLGREERGKKIADVLKICPASKWGSDRKMDQLVFLLEEVRDLVFTKGEDVVTLLQKMMPFMRVVADEGSSQDTVTCYPEEIPDFVPTDTDLNQMDGTDAELFVLLRVEGFVSAAIGLTPQSDSGTTVCKRGV